MRIRLSNISWRQSDEQHDPVMLCELSCVDPQCGLRSFHIGPHWRYTWDGTSKGSRTAYTKTRSVWPDGVLIWIAHPARLS